MKTSNPIRNSVPFFATACLVAGASFYASAAPCAAMPQSDGNAIQEQSQRRAKFATVRLDQGLAVGRPSGWRVKRSGSSVMLVPPPSVAVSVVVSIGPWDATRRLGDDAEQERLRQTHIAAAPGFLAAGEAVLGEGWLSLDYERESTSDSDAAMRIFVRPVGDRAVTLAIVGARSAIDRGERDWISIANTIGVQTDAIDGIHVDHDSSGDDFGVSLTAGDILLANNDLVSWSGSAVFAVDINQLNSGNFTFQNYGESVIAAGNPFGTLPLQINVSTVPEPASIGLLTAAAVGWVARRRRRRSRKAIGSTAVLSA